MKPCAYSELRAEMRRAAVEWRLASPRRYVRRAELLSRAVFYRNSAEKYRARFMAGGVK